jgi:hypothetical protein
MRLFFLSPGLRRQIYESPVKDLFILHAQVEAGTESEQRVDLPPFLDVECRIHNNQEDDAKYGAFAVSLIPTLTQSPMLSI